MIKKFTSTVTPVTNSNICTRRSLCFIPTISKTLSLAENRDFALASGPIEARQFFKIQAQARREPDPKSPSPIDNSMWRCVHFVIILFYRKASYSRLQLQSLGKEYKRRKL